MTRRTLSDAPAPDPAQVRRILQYIKRTVDEAPPLTEGQKDKLRANLSPMPRKQSKHSLSEVMDSWQ